MEANSMQIPLIVGSEGDTYYLHDNGIGKPIQGQKQNEPIKNAVQDGLAPKHVHKFYFVKFWPYEDPNLKARMEEAERLIEKMKEDLFLIEERRKERMSNRDLMYSLLKRLSHHYTGLGCSVAWKKEELHPLQLALDKLCFANNASRGTADKLHSSVKELDNLSLHFWMLHGRNSLAEEKKLLRKMSESQRRAADSCLSVEELSSPIWGLKYQMQCKRNSSAEERQLLREIKQLEWAREKGIAAAVKGKMWDSLGAKEAIKEQGKLFKTELDGLRKHQLGAEIKSAEEELKDIEHELSSLDKQLANIHRRKYVAQCEQIRELKYQMQWKRNSSAEERRLLGEIKQLEWEREKTIANAAVEGKIWDSLGSKEAIKEQVKPFRSELDELRKKQLEVGAEIKSAEKELEVIENELNSLDKQLSSIHHRKDVVHQRVLKMRRQHHEENDCYCQYLSLLNNARELAQKKDVAALYELSNREVDEFMSQWSNNKTFRDDYEKRILPSLNGRLLSSDGRMRISEKSLVLESPTNIKPETLKKAKLKWQKKDSRAPQ